jgi:ABC-type branched-subunit amino acid transport system substrate-binding protein
MSRLLVRPVLVALVLGLAAFALAACGSSSSSSSSSTSTETGGSTEESNSGGGGEEASGEPIKVMSMTVVSTELNASEIQESIEARAEMINEEGGINGRPLEVSVCNTKIDPNVTVQCARQAVSENVAAVLGGLVFFPQVYPILEQAGIPFIGGLGISPEELNAPISFPVGGGEPAWFFGEAKLLKEKGVEHPALVTCEPESCQWAYEVFVEGWEKLGGGEVKKILVPEGQTDMSSTAASATEGDIDGLALATYDSVNSQLIKAIRQTGFEGPAIINATNISTETIKSLGPLSKGLYVSGLELPATSNEPPAKAYRAAMEKYKPGANLTELGTNAWASADLFIKIAEGVKGEVDASTIKEALESESGVIETEISPPWTTPTTPVNPKYTRLQTIEAAISEAQPNGTLEQEKPGFTNVAE